ncbi:hypothetical protein [Fonticella tunisiensis]|uniref:Uncharacterized protein n=1 Tax=Fonticella tunisiensis TaxID=1096341 RepID=A0A4R7KB70_9CLOT|nr:hypothetical protein [Fonticella tunisiensis]TDT51228.1 hypothetical protein EDD71_1209 [Fonticella tunisiensis]
MNSGNLNSNNFSFLDRIRIMDGTEELKSIFNRLIKDNANDALSLINHENLHFPSLFLLSPEIEKSNLFNNLSLRNQIALQITNEILLKENSNTKVLKSEYRKRNYPVLKWMLETGFMDFDIGDEYDEVLDIVSAILTTEYRDKSALPIISDMIFKRNRKGHYFYDLVWAFFQCRDPYSLSLIANYLHSRDIKDVKLSHRLLSFIPDMAYEMRADNEKQYSFCIRWIRENGPFLYFTGENFHQTSRPTPYKLSLEAKYLCKSICLDNGKPIAPVTEEEQRLLDNFNKLNDDIRMLLANCSVLLNHQNLYWWNMWIHYPLSEQIKIARTRIGGLE